MKENELLVLTSYF